VLIFLLDKDLTNRVNYLSAGITSISKNNLCNLFIFIFAVLIFFKIRI